MVEPAGFASGLDVGHKGAESRVTQVTGEPWRHGVANAIDRTDLGNLVQDS